MTVATTTNRLSVAQVAQLARAAGFPADEISTAVAVAVAESGLNPRAKNNTPATGDYSIGLWQINMRAHGSRYGTEEQLKHPVTNARAAYAIWTAAGRKWSPWGAYTNGSYRAHLGATVGGGINGFAGAGILDDLEDGVTIVGGLASGNPTGVAAAAADLLGLDNLRSQILTIGLSLLFTTAALAIIAVGLFRLTGTDAGKIFSAASTAAGGAGVVKAVT